MANLALPFQAVAPDCDETPLPQEKAAALVVRLATTKAASLVPHYPDNVIIGADQVCVVKRNITGKPYTFYNAKAQLQACSGKKITFYTGIAVIDAKTNTMQTHCERFYVHFRHLSDAEIEGYLHKEQPYHCAGSFKCDGLGICLFKRLEGDDIHTLIGLPLIRLTQMLNNIGINPLLA